MYEHLPRNYRAKGLHAYGGCIKSTMQNMSDDIFESKEPRENGPAEKNSGGGA